VDNYYPALFLWYDLGMRQMASVDMLLNSKDEPGVKITASNDFMELEPIQRVSLLVAAVQLCGVAISAIITDNPDDELDIRELLESVEIRPLEHDLN